LSLTSRVKTGSIVTGVTTSGVSGGSALRRTMEIEGQAREVVTLTLGENEIIRGTMR
jgi:hypothetical protein